MRGEQILRRLGMLLFGIGVVTTMIGNIVVNARGDHAAGHVTRSAGLILALCGLIGFLTVSVTHRVRSRVGRRAHRFSSGIAFPIPPRRAGYTRPSASVSLARVVAVILWVMAGLQAAQHLWSLTGMAVGGGPFAWLAVWWGFLLLAMPACLGLALWLMANMAQQVESMWIAINAHRAEVPIVARAVPLPATGRTPQPVVSGAASDIDHDTAPTQRMEDER